MIDRYLINRRYARLWAGQTTSLLGDAAFNTTLVLWVVTVLAKSHGHTASWAPIAVGALATTMGAAVLLVGPLSGVFVDRWNRRNTMLRTEVLRMTVVGALGAVSFLPVDALPIAVWLTCIYVVVFVVDGAGQFFNQSRFAVIGDVVDGPVQRARAAGIGQATAGAVSIIGPPIAAPLLITIGLQWALLFNALTYVVSYIMIRSVGLAGPVTRTADPAGPSNLGYEFREGLRWFAGHRYMKRILYGFLIASLGAGSLTSLMVFFITANLHVSARLLGFVDACFGAGAIIGALVSARLVKLLGARRVIWLGMLIGGMLVVILARQTTFIGGVVLFVAIALPTIAYNTALTPVLLAHTPKEFLGRMQAVLLPALQLGSIASVLISGWLASTALSGFHARLAGIAIGPYDTLFTICGLLIVVAALYMRLALPHDVPTTDPATAPASDLVPEPI